jgi:hypothetical protein
MITDASNHELDRLNQRAQEQRAAAGELGEQRVPSRIALTGLPSSGTRSSSPPSIACPASSASRTAPAAAVVAATSATSSVRGPHRGAQAARGRLSTREFDGLRLAYAQHVYKAQGLTTDRALVLTGGWQTDREAQPTSLSPARASRTDIYTSREDLGHQGIDSDAIDRLAERAQREQRPAGEHHPRPARARTG